MIKFCLFRYVFIIILRIYRKTYCSYVINNSLYVIIVIDFNSVHHSFSLPLKIILLFVLLHLGTRRRCDFSETRGRYLLKKKKIPWNWVFVLVFAEKQREWGGRGLESQGTAEFFLDFQSTSYGPFSATITFTIGPSSNNILKLSPLWPTYIIQFQKYNSLVLFTNEFLENYVLKLHGMCLKDIWTC